MTFDSMFRAIHGFDPFPWQSEAASRLISGEGFFAVNVPTASGKTAMIDAAVYAASKGGPRRIVFIIDRKVVVDEAYARAERIVEALKTEPLMAEFAARLGPAQVVRLRGGVHGDDDWVLYPERLTIIVSTVDQVGSRLLHRGYGVSPRMTPLHAGFLGNNALYIVDEAHLSIPFIETVESACRYGADIRSIKMTATPTAKESEMVELSSKDRSVPMLKKRLQARKIARLVLCSDKEKEFVKEAVFHSKRLADSVRVVAVVVNRVNTARSIYRELIRSHSCSVLLTGRSRPYDRDRLMRRVLPEIRAGRVREKGDPLFVVATQTVEVGADFDFDALVTEGATLDALRQRFGRLDRLGELCVTNGVILYRPKFDKNENLVPDPIYGDTAHQVWEWLQDIAEEDCVDFGIEAMEENMKRSKAPISGFKHAPVLLASHVLLLSQTGPEAPYMDISSWLHGAQSSSADVSLIWRADLSPEQSEIWEETVRMRPPLNREALEIPVYAARAWLEGLQVQDFSDIEGTGSFADNRIVSGLRALRWRGPDDCRVVYADDIRPGDTLVVPNIYGGCDQYGWDSKCKTAVDDIADFCSLERGRQHMVRLVPGLTGWLGGDEKAIEVAMNEIIISETEVDSETGIDRDRVEAAHKALRDLLGKINHPLIDAFKGKYEIERHPLGILLRGRVIDEVSGTLRNGVAVELSRHLGGVARFAEEFAKNHPELERIVRAAHQHDYGKAEPRFQAMLHGNSIDSAGGALLAKSGLRRLTQVLASYADSGVPKGFRHELASLQLRPPGKEPEQDILVKYLIATHHGYGRPWFPLCDDSETPGVNHIWLGSGWVNAFAILLEQYGPWKLTGMELLLRAADARQSRTEQEEADA